tara:strand:- start:1169 stop:1657 length:489 start_codon:yes stop_codon:yes gene_type:complete
MGKKSRNKGANFERAIARKIREWLGEDWEVKRNPTDRQKGKAGAGEFEIVGPFEFPFAIECKAHESFDYSQLFRVPVTGPFESFWKQAKNQAEAAEKAPLLIFKRNNGPVLVALNWKGFWPLIAASGIDAVQSLLRLYSYGCVVIPLEVLLSIDPLALYEIQ